MSGRGKRKDDDFIDDSDAPAPPKKAPKTVESDESDSITVCEISKNRKVTVRNWNGKIWVDIRDFYTKDGKQLPGKKGISLTVEQWNILRDHAGDIDKALGEGS